jgi:protein ImuB
VSGDVPGALPDATAPTLPTGIAPIARLELTAEDVVPAGLHQGGLWGASSGQDARARRALEHVQGLLGGEQVLTVRLQGGRDAASRVHVAPWGSAAPVDRAPDRPWPGGLPEPSPASVLDPPTPVTLLDPAGHRVVVTGRGRMSGPPATLRVQPVDLPGAASVPALVPAETAVHDWAGPWLLDERWWTPRAARRAYLQVVLGDGRAALLAGTDGDWRIEALYD